MGVQQKHDWARAAASALDWWDAAGVDSLTTDLPCDWLRLSLTPAAVPGDDPAPRQTRAAPAAAPVAPAPMPDTLAAFEAWRLSDAAPDAAMPGRRIGAVGPHQAPMMVIVDLPDRDDLTEGMLLSGAAGRLFDRMLTAIGTSRAAIYLAPMCVTRPTAGRIPPEAEAAIAAALRHHIALARPQRLLIFGNAPGRAILGADVASARGRLRTVNYPGGTVGAVASFHPRFLLDRPAAKADAWKDLQLLIERGAR